MEINEDNYLAHYGVLRRSGRYPWGSGLSPEEHNRSFLSAIDEMRNKHGMSDAEIARAFDLNSKQFREEKSIAKNAVKQANINMAQRLKDKGYSNVQIGVRMGLNESSVRALLAPGEQDKVNILNATSEILKQAVDEKHYVDIGAGVERHMNVSSDKLSKSVALLKQQGYTVHYIKVKQVGTGKETTVKVLAAPNTPYGEVYKNRDNIQQVMGYSEDGGRSFDRIQTPLSIDSSRVHVRYAEEGGADADGVIYVRPGVRDVSLGNSRYAQVRVAVDGSHYLKGMAMYKDDLPAGADLVFNTNKSRKSNKLDAMKPMTNDPDNPFGSLIKRQLQEEDGKGGRRVYSAMNIVNEEGDWEKWSKTLSSQMLSKQSSSLAREQLEEARKRKLDEFDNIMHTDNPAVRRRLLQAFADSADSSAVHLKAAALPRQGSHVILPIDSMKPTEIYAPNYRDGEKVVLIRHPHGGKFEIPELTVNNKHPEAKRLLGQAKDAVGIHTTVAERLSGADFDGDTVLVIPNNGGKVQHEPALEGLKGFDPKHAFPGYEGMAKMTEKQKSVEMGKISNLITDMSLRGATNAELARAVRHSMVVIDAEKHGLDWKESARANGISQLKEKYQGGPRSGATTLISQARSDVRVNDLRPRSAEDGGPIDKQTGKKVYDPTPRTYVDYRTGKTEVHKRKSKLLAETEDAHALSSGTPIEAIYAEHSNSLKALANKARAELVNIKSTEYSPAAREKYKDEVRTLDAKLDLAIRNSPLERQAQIVANSIIRAKKEANPDMSKKDLAKISSLALTDARNRVGAQKPDIEISDKEWEAIQAGAITNNKLTQILTRANLDRVKELATPKERKVLSEDKKTRAVMMLRNGYTQAEVADALGVSVSTLKRNLAEGGD